MDLIVNDPAAQLSSRGVQRYLASVMSELRWEGEVEHVRLGRWRTLERPKELLRRGRSEAVFWTPCQRGPLRARNHVVTVHDCINVEYAHVGDWRLPAFRRLFQSVLRSAAGIVAISGATRDAILRNYDVPADAITVIRSPDDVGLLVSLPASTGGTSVPRKPFILLVTNALRHKNALVACQAYTRSRAAARGTRLVVVGALPPPALEICRGQQDNIETLPAVDDAALADLYRRCQFVLSPSLAEGHNLIVAEALASGANVLCSDIPVHREFYEGRVVFFDPTSVDALVSAIDRAVEQSGRWVKPPADLASRTFAQVARDYEALFRSIAAGTG
jgi:glycosyltransferase involved in cell wall biosynthesis